MHDAGAETDPSDTINEIIFSTRKVARSLSAFTMCICSLWALTMSQSCLPMRSLQSAHK